jgi:hypothetical protein
MEHRNQYIIATRRIVRLQSDPGGMRRCLALCMQSRRRQGSMHHTPTPAGSATARLRLSLAFLTVWLGRTGRPNQKTVALDRRPQFSSSKGSFLQPRSVGVVTCSLQHGQSVKECPSLVRICPNMRRTGMAIKSSMECTHRNNAFRERQTFS